MPRQSGGDGDLPGFRNWSNDAHVADLARVWNVDPMDIPHYSPPTHVMQMMRYAEDGSIRMLWVSGTNPAVSLPELRRIRSILEQERLFLVVQDIFLSETAQLADVVLPAATWVRRPAPSPTWTAPCTCPRRRWSRQARSGRTWTSSSTTPAAWTCGTETGNRW